MRKPNKVKLFENYHTKGLQVRMKLRETG